MAAVLRFTEDFAGSGDLNGSKVGATQATWIATAGLWSRTSGLAKTAAAASTNPVCVTDLSVADADVTMDAYMGFGGGDALYFRTSDQSNWWRLRQRTTQTSSTYVSGYTGTGWVVQSTYHYAAGPAGTYYSGYQNGVPTIRQTFVKNPDGSPYGPGTYSGTYSTQSVVPVYSTSTQQNRYLVLEKSDAGTVTLVDSWRVSSFAHLRVVATGSSIQYFEPDGLTVHATTTDAFNDTATAYGFGLGGNDSYNYASAIDNWVAQLSGSAATPSIVSPVTGSDVEFVTGAAVQVKANYPPGDDATSVDVRWRKAGDSAWTEVDGALTGSGSWTFPLSGLTTPVQIEIQARSTDSFSTVSEWSSSTFFTFRTRPAVPTFVAPASGDLVTALQVAIVDFGAGVMGMQARRVADGSGSPDENTIYQDNLEIDLLPDGTYRLVGDGVTHTTGTEYVEARRQTADGGSLWSAWVSLLVTEQVAQPYPPLYDWVTLADDASVEFTLTPQPADELHKATVRIEIQRDGVRVFAAGVTDGESVTWTDSLAGAGSDYIFTAIADDETKAQVS